ncbi:MAG: extracellular solute-binding protein [Lachnospiraceae bacterium]|nr:extracellular solute-binding protein [Lachnospiraceae bacterium]
MRLKAKIFMLAAVLVIAATLLSGCAGLKEVEISGLKELKPGLQDLWKKFTHEEEDNGQSWFSSKETIYFWYSDETLTDYINSAAVAFGEREGVRVLPVLCTESEYLEAIDEATLHSGQTPDVYLLSNDLLEKAYLAGLAAPVQDPMELCTEAHFPKAALDAVTYRDKIVAYPMFYETGALVYNQTYLEAWAKQQAEKAIVNGESGDEETDTGEPIDSSELDEEAVAAKMLEYLENAVPDTVDDILNIADTFDVPEGVEGIMKWDVSDIFYNYWFVGNYMIVGGDVGDEEENIHICNQEAIDCLTVYQALNQFFSIESDIVNYQSVVQDFIDGKIVFTIGTTDVLEKLTQAQEEGELAFEYGVAKIPDVSDKLQSRALSVTNGVVVNGYSEHKTLANAFAAYLTGECAATLYERTGRMSSNKSANTDDALLQVFFEEYGESVSLPKMMETENFWLQLEVLFAKVWNGEDVTALVKELDANMALQLEGAR